MSMSTASNVGSLSRRPSWRRGSRQSTGMCFLSFFQTWHLTYTDQSPCQQRRRRDATTRRFLSGR